LNPSSEQNAESLRLPETALTQGYRLVAHDEIGSTNDEAVACARAGDPGKLWIVVRAQNRGRGRQGRQWTSPPGNLYTSLLLLDAVPPPQAPELGFVVGIALARALRFLTADDPRLRIKWPNDILFEGAKLAGILLESVRLADGRLACVIGIGVNCASSPSDVPYKVTSLETVLGRAITPQDVLSTLSVEFIRWLEVWSAGAGFDKIRAEWLALAAGIGAPIKVVMPTRVLEGLFRTIDETGRLIIETPEAVMAVEAGDIFFVDRPKGTLAGFSD
jgi:BirA family transcriptional regulator, biotin operon repressor / biotin---[acetyl-CoA-carboxylase] ligase